MSQFLGAIAAGLAIIAAGILIAFGLAMVLGFLYLFIYTPIAAVVGM